MSLMPLNSSRTSPIESFRPLTALLGLAAICLCGHLHFRREVNAAQPDRVAPQARSTEPGSTPEKRPANRLSRETSPYLLLHAHNPVDWYPWGPEAFAKAKAEGKPVFLSIGYSSCYWCHVMERQVFSDPEIAKYMNEHFINIKVDREERPDVDEVYMTALEVYFQAVKARQSGGWPLSMFLTPQGKPLGGGTYFPPKDDEEQQRVGFPTLLKSVVEAWTDKREQMQGNADILARAVQGSARMRVALEKVPLERDLVTAAVGSLSETFDPEYGGFGFDAEQSAKPKFPVPVKLALLQYQARRRGDQELANMLQLTLERMAAGGIRDQLGGGFHRYSTDRFWRVPHFEKMLYDNAQLADVYLEAFRQTQDPLYQEVAEGIFTFVLRDLTDPRGGFYSALDAETDGVEGRYYVWTRAEIEQVLTADELRLSEAVYGLDNAPNFEEFYVLQQVRSLGEAAEQLQLSLGDAQEQIRTVRMKLLAARVKRPALMRDDKILTSWNGLMIRALANGGVLLKRREYVQAAEKAALFLLTSLRDEKGRLLRTYRAGQAKLPAYLDDYAFLVEGLVALHQATGDQKWLNAAQRLTDSQLELFWDDKDKACFFTANDQEELLVRTKPIADSVLPSGNSVTIRNLLRLASLGKQPRYRERAEQTLTAFAPLLKESPRAVVNLALALGEYIDNPDFSIAANPQAQRQAPAANRGRIQLAADEKPAKPRSVRPVVEHVKGKVLLSVDRLPAGGKCQVAVQLTIDEPWHINSNPAADEFVVPTELSLKSKLKVKLTRIAYPNGEELEVAGQDKPQSIYKGQVLLRGVLDVPASAGGNLEELDFQIRYQACKENQCLVPKTLSLKLPVAVARKGEAVKTANGKLFPPAK